VIRKLLDQNKKHTPERVLFSLNIVTALCSFLLQLSVNANELAFSAFVLELYETFDQREQCIVFATANVFAGLPFRAALTRKNIAAENLLPAEFFQTQPLRMRIAAVS
jgi:hypothetical protein